MGWFILAIIIISIVYSVFKSMGWLILVPIVAGFVYRAVKSKRAGYRSRREDNTSWNNNTSWKDDVPLENRVSSPKKSAPSSYINSAVRVGASAKASGEIKEIEPDYMLFPEHFANVVYNEEDNLPGFYDKQSKIVSIFKKKWFDLLCKEFIVVDIETTGLSKSLDYILEISAIRYMAGTEIETFSTLIDPGVPIPREVIDIHGISNEIVRGKPSIEKVLPQFLDFVGDSLIVGHNVNFDIGFIEVWSRRIGRNPIWNYVDTMSIAKKTILGLSNYKQKTILDAMGYAQSTYHRAEDDCRGCAQIVLNAIEKLSSKESEAPQKETSQQLSKYQKLGDVPLDHPDYEYYERHLKIEEYRSLNQAYYGIAEKLPDMYKQINASGDFFSPLAEEYLQLCAQALLMFEDVRNAMIDVYGHGTQSCVGIPQCIILLEKRVEYARAIGLCHRALSLGIDDGTKAGIEGRMDRLHRKSGLYI